MSRVGQLKMSRGRRLKMSRGVSAGSPPFHRPRGLDAPLLLETVQLVIFSVLFLFGLIVSIFI